MSDTPTREEVLASIVPDSTQLNAEDCIAGPLTVTVERVTKNNDKKQPHNIHLVGYDRVFRPCKTCRRILIALWTDAADTWIGKRLTLYTDPDVLFKGIKVGGLRISHVSGIDKPKTLILACGRTQRKEFTIHPLMDLTPKQQEFVDEATKEIQAAETLSILRAHGEKLKEEAPAVQDALRPVYAKRKKELEK